MFRKYEKTYRIDTPGKRNLDPATVKQLLAGQVVVEEKIDGANVGIIRHKRGFHLQKRGSLVSTSEHAQFQFFHAWANHKKWEQIMSMPQGYIVYGELMRCIHTIIYDDLPDWFIAFDVWDGRRYLDRHEREDFVALHGFEHIPLVAEGHFSLDEIKTMIPERSAYGPMAEGIVVKKYNKKRKRFMKGKWVRPEFKKAMSEHHWTQLPVTFNTVRS